MGAKGLISATLPCSEMTPGCRPPSGAREPVERRMRSLESCGLPAGVHCTKVEPNVAMSAVEMLLISISFS